MAFNSKPPAGSQDEGCHYASTETAAVWPRTSTWVEGEDKEFCGGGWGGWADSDAGDRGEGVTIGIMVGTRRRE